MGNTANDQLERLQKRIALIKSRPALQSRLTAIGYPPENIEAMAQKHEQAVAGRTQCRNQHAAQKAANQELQAMLKVAKQRYSDLAAIARRKFRKNEPALDTLGLRISQRAPVSTTNGAVKRISDARPAFLDRARAIYDGLLHHPELLAEIQTIDYNAERLAAERSDIAAIEDSFTEEQTTKLDAKQATAAQQQLMAEIDKWTKDFVLFTSISLRDMPTELAAMGIRPRR